MQLPLIFAITMLNNNKVPEFDLVEHHNSLPVVDYLEHRNEDYENLRNEAIQELDNYSLGPESTHPFTESSTQNSTEL